MMKQLFYRLYVPDKNYKAIYCDGAEADLWRVAFQKAGFVTILEESHMDLTEMLEWLFPTHSEPTDIYCRWEN